METDLTVVVGDETFHHYSQLLCQYPYFDNMLTVNMEERNTSSILFPEKDPKEWLEVYKCLVSNDLTVDMQALVQKDNARKQPLRLMHWFDYICAESIITKYDELTAIYKDIQLQKHNKATYCYWSEISSLSCPLLKNVVKKHFKVKMMRLVWFLARYNQPMCSKELSEIKFYLLDEECGEEMWNHLLRDVCVHDDVLGKQLVKENRIGVAGCPLFEFFLQETSKHRVKRERK